MSPQERRAAIVNAALPLVTQHGTNVTTSQIARAAGIAEGTVFRVFSDKRELLLACVDAAVRAEPVVEEIRRIPRDLDLQTRLVRTAEALDGHMRGMGALMHALGATGFRLERGPELERYKERRQWNDDVLRAVVEVIEPDQDALRLSAERAARILLSLVFGERMGCGSFGGTVAGSDELIDFFLRGALRAEPGGH